MRYSILILLLFVAVSGEAQNLLTNVDFNRLGNVEAQGYLQNQIDNNILYFSDNRASLSPFEETSGFKKQTLDYFFKSDPGELWRKYTDISPADAWNCKKVKLNLCFSKKENTLFYPDDIIARLDTGQLVYLNLHFLFGLYKIPMAFEITRIDEENMLIEFSYLKGNTSEGKQVLRFLKTNKSNTIIEHTSYFRSKSFLRDHLLYPHFHKKVTNDFHRNMWRRIEDQE